MLRSILTLAALSLGLGVWSPACTWGQVSEQELPSQRALSSLGLERVWWGQAILNTTRDTVEHLVIDEDTVFVQSTSGITTAFDAETGRQLWAVQLGRFDQPSFPATSTEDSVMIVVGTKMYSLESRTGKLQWELRLPGSASTGPSADDRNVYVGTLDGSIYAFSRRKIRELTLERRLPQWSYESLVWRYQAGKEITSPPLVNGRSVNFASRNGNLYAISAENSKLLYQFETDGAIVAPLASANDQQYVASEDFSFYSLDAQNGRVSWEFTSGLPIRKAPLAVGEDLFLLPERGGMVSISVKDGTRKWTRKEIVHFVAMTTNAVFGTDEEGFLIKVERASGTPLGRLFLRQYSHPVSNIRTDRLFMSTSTGRVICLRPLGRELPLYHRYPERQPILPLVTPEEDPAAPADSDGAAGMESPDDSTLDAAEEN